MKNLEERRNLPMVLRNETLQKTDQQIGCVPPFVLIPVGHSMRRNLKCNTNHDEHFNEEV